MLSYELDALKRLHIPVKRWGSSFRVKVKNQYGRAVYISNFTNGRNRKLLAKQYQVTEARIARHFTPNYKPAGAYSVYKNSIKEVHLFENFDQQEVMDKIRLTLGKPSKAYKANVQLGYKLVDRVTGVERTFTPATNTELFKAPIAINSKDDIEKKIMAELGSKDFAERLSFPSSAWALKEITSTKVQIYYREHILGDNIVIPDSIKLNRFIIGFPKTNNKCVFYCIAFHLEGGVRADRMIGPTKTIVKRYCQFKGIQYSVKLFREMKPIDIMQFDELENCFKLSINVFEMDEQTHEISKTRESDTYENRINILDYKGHAMYITNLDIILSKYPCNRCGAVLDDARRLLNHKKNKCHLEVIESFPKNPTIYRPQENQLKKILTQFRINTDHYIDHFICYDFEAILKPIAHKRGESTVYTNKHIPVSVSICNSLTEEVKCFINDSPLQLIKDMFDYIGTIVDEIQKYNYRKYDSLLKAVEDLEKTHQKVTSILDQVPILGFNSGKYDVNLIKNDLFTVIGVKNIRTVIKNPGYMCISTKNYKMLDISNYVPAGTSLDKYLTTYLGGCKCDEKISCTCGLSKGVFPYEYITSFDVLDQKTIPVKRAFDSHLKGTPSAVMTTNE